MCRASVVAAVVVVVLNLFAAAMCGCEIKMPSEAREPTLSEAAAIMDVLDRFEARLPLTEYCRAYADAALVLDADVPALKRRCRRCAPIEAGDAGCDREQYGAAAACVQFYEDGPLFVIWDGLEPGELPQVVHHETTHAVGLCERVPGSYGHGSETLWGADGVHPL
jgi:hypothetical protein